MSRWEDRDTMAKNLKELAKRAHETMIGGGGFRVRPGMLDESVAAVKADPNKLRDMSTALGVADPFAGTIRGKCNICGSDITILAIPAHVKAEYDKAGGGKTVDAAVCDGPCRHAVEMMSNSMGLQEVSTGMEGGEIKSTVSGKPDSCAPCDCPKCLAARKVKLDANRKRIADTITKVATNGLGRSLLKVRLGMAGNSAEELIDKTTPAFNVLGVDIDPSLMADKELLESFIIGVVKEAMTITSDLVSDKFTQSLGNMVSNNINSRITRMVIEAVDKLLTVRDRPNHEPSAN